MRWLVVLAVVLADAVSVRAAEWPDDRDKVLPCRPTIACTADLVPPGAFEVELGGLYRRVGAGATAWSEPLLVKQTLTPRWQLQLLTNGYTVIQGKIPLQFLDDVAVGPKFHAFDQAAVRPSVSFSALLSVPTFHRTGYLRTYDLLFTAYVSKDFGPVHADWNLGLNVWRIEQPSVQAWNALALAMPIAGPLGIMVEGYVFSDAAPLALRDGGLLSALSFTARPWLVFDAGGDVGFFPATRAFSLFVGMTIVPVVFWRPSA